MTEPRDLAQRILDAVRKAVAFHPGDDSLNAPEDRVLAAIRAELPMLPLVALVVGCNHCPLFNDEWRVCTHPSIGNVELGTGRETGEYGSSRPSWCPLPTTPVLVRDGV